MYFGSGENLVKRLFQLEDTCRRCGVKFSVQQGLDSRLANGLEETRGDILMCPNCRTVYETHLNASKLTLLNDVTSRYFKKQTTAPQPDISQTPSEPEASCRRCGVRFSYKRGLDSRLASGLEEERDDILMCPYCHAVYEIHLDASKLLLLNDVTSRYFKKQTTASQPDISQAPTSKKWWQFWK